MKFMKIYLTILHLVLLSALLASPGYLVLSGGALKGNNAEIYGKIIELASEDIDGDGELDYESARIGIITASSSDPFYAEDNGAYYVSRFAQHGGYAEWIPIYYDPAYPTVEYDPDPHGEIEAYYWEMTSNAQVLAQISTMTGFFFGGGDQSRYIRVFFDNDHNESPALAMIREKLNQQGAVVAGTSAGTAIQAGGNTEKIVTSDWNLYQYVQPEPGLPNGFVNAVFIDSQNRIWMGTDEGVAVLSGNIWIEYNEDNSGLIGGFSTVYDIAEDIDGSIWFSTFGGIVHFKEDVEEWITYTTSNTPLPANKSYAITIDNEGIKWIGTIYGLASFDNESWNVYDHPEMEDALVFCIEVEYRLEEKLVWIGMDGYIQGNDMALAQYNVTQQNWEYYYYQDNFNDDTVYDITIDSQGVKWCGGYWGIHRLDNGNVDTWDPDARTLAVATDSGDQVWFGGYHYGLGTIANDTMVFYDTSNSDLPLNYINDLTFDAEDTIWIATDGSGGASFDGDDTWEIFNIVTPPALPSNTVNDVYVNVDDILWTATDEGIARYDFDSWQIFTEDDVLPDNMIYAIEAEGLGTGRIWFGTAEGPVFYENDIWDLPDNAPDDPVFCLEYEELSHKIWLGTDDGLYGYDGNNWEHYALELPSREILSLLYYQGLWIGTDNGLVFYDGDSFILYDETDGLPGMQIYSMSFLPDDSIAIGTGNGLAIYDQTQDSFTVPEIELPSQMVKSLIYYKAQTGFETSIYLLAIGTDAGIITWSFNEGETELLNTTNSELPSNTINSLYADRNYYLWISTDNGLSNYIKDYKIQGEIIPMITGGNSYRALIKGSYGYFTDEYDDLTYVPEGGFGFFPYGLLDSHFSRRGRQGRAIRLAADTGMDFVFGCDENTALVTYFVGSDSCYMEVLGQYRENGVNIIDLSEAIITPQVNDEIHWSITNLKTHYLTKHDKYFPLTKEIEFASWKNQITPAEEEPYTSSDIFESPYNPRPNYQSSYLSEYMFISTRLFESTFSNTFGTTYEDFPVYKVEMIKDPFYDSRGYVGGLGNETFWSYGNLIVNILPDMESLAMLQKLTPARLESNYPNPFNPETTIRYTVRKPGKISLDIYNIKGQHIKNLVKSRHEEGFFEIIWHGDDKFGRSVTSGLYFYRVEHDNEQCDVRKMVLIK